MRKRKYDTVPELNKRKARMTRAVGQPLTTGKGKAGGMDLEKKKYISEKGRKMCL